MPLQPGPGPDREGQQASRISPANSASATLTVSGTAGWVVSISWFWRADCVN